MSNWSIVDLTYIYDGSFEGLLTLVFNSYVSNTFPIQIYTKKNYENNILDTPKYIETDYTKAERIYNGIVKNISYDTLYYAYNSFLSNTPKKELTILEYLCNAFKIGPKINTMLSIDYVFNTIAMSKNALGECHKLKGLLRFSEIKNNLYYASIHPDNNILEPLGQHFIRRLPTQNFIIHDKNQNIVFLYNTKTYRIINDIVLPNIQISDAEQEYRELWKKFFNTIAIKERTNPRLQMQYMPKKYWQDLTEKN